MIINNELLAPFTTPEDEKRHEALVKELVAAAMRVQEASRQLHKAMKENKGDRQAAEREFQEAWAKRDEIERADRQLRATIERRYIEAFNGDIEAIIADAYKIIDAVTKQDFYKWSDTMREGLKPLTEHEPTKPEKPPRDAPKHIKEQYAAERKQYKTAKDNYDAAKEMTKRVYDTFIDFVQPLVRLQRNALNYYDAEEKQLQITAKIEQKAASFYHKPKNSRHTISVKIELSEPAQLTEIERVQEEAIEAVQRKTGIGFNFPVGQAENHILSVYEAGEHLAELPERMTQVSKGYTLSYKSEEVKDQNNETATLETLTKSIIGKTEEIEVTIMTYQGKNTNPAKLFVLSLIKANEQAIFNNQLTRNYITFPLTELIELGMYSTIQSARKGFKDMRRGLLSTQVGGTISSKKKKGQNTPEYDTLKVLFTDADIVNGQCIIYLNPRLNWGGIAAQAFTILPSYCFQLHNKAFALLEYIFYLARQNTKKLYTDGYFTISNRAIQHRLLLPNEDEVGYPARDIKAKIDEAITEIETKHSLTYNNTELKLLQQPADRIATMPVKEYLNEGYLQVSISGEMVKPFAELEETRLKRIEARKKKEEKIVHDAKVKNMQKALQAAKEAKADT